MFDIEELIPWEMKVANTVLRGHHSVPSGKPVMHFLHGNGFSGLSYWPFLKQFTVHFDLFINCVQGQGDSDTSEPFWGWNHHALHTAEVWNNFQHLWQDVPKIAMGHSFGGVVSSLMLADKALCMKENIVFQKLILLDPVFFTPPMLGVMSLSEFFGFGSISSLAKITLKRTRTWPDREAAFASLCGKGLFKTWHPDAMEAYVEFALKNIPEGVGLKCAPEMEAAIFASYPRKLWSSLKRLPLPAVMLYGAETYPFVRAAAKKIVNRNKRVIAEQVAGGHCFMQEYPKDSYNRVKPYLDSFILPEESVILPTEDLLLSE